MSIVPTDLAATPVIQVKMEPLGFSMDTLEDGPPGMCVVL